MDLARPICTYGREKILRLQAVSDIFEFLTVAGKENRSGSWPVADPDDIPLQDIWTIRSTIERLVMTSLAIGNIGYRVLVPASILLAVLLEVQRLTLTW